MFLLVEDNPNDEPLTLRAVPKYIPHGTIVARGGVEVLDFLFGTGPHQGRDLSIRPFLVLLNLELPKVNGLEALRRIRGDARTRVVPTFSPRPPSSRISWTATISASTATSACQWITASSAVT